MRWAVSTALALALAVAAAPLAARAQVPPYRLDWLGQDFYPFALNDRGQVVGYRGFPGERSALLWQDGVATDLGAGEAHDINNAGQIVLRPAAGGPPAVVREPDGSLTPVNVLRAWGSDFRHQYSINSRGQVVGMERFAGVSPDGRAFLWDGGAVSYLDTVLPETAFASAHAVNNHGAAAGWWGTRDTGGGFVWQDGNVTRLPTPAVSINDAGQVLTLAAEVWDNGTITALPRLPLLPVTDPAAGVEIKPAEINNLGQVAGHQWELYLIDTESGYGSIERAFLWDEAGGMRDLNAAMGIVPDARNQLALAVPTDVNDVGQIVGYGPQCGWLLTPVPEPGAGLVAMMLGGCFLFRRSALKN
jgi:uncharacterized membrane protein